MRAQHISWGQVFTLYSETLWFHSTASVACISAPLPVSCSSDISYLNTGYISPSSRLFLNHILFTAFCITGLLYIPLCLGLPFLSRRNWKKKKKKDYHYYFTKKKGEKEHDTSKTNPLLSFNSSVILRFSAIACLLRLLSKWYIASTRGAIFVFASPQSCKPQALI